MNKDQEMLDETRVMERLTDETTVIDMAKIRNEQNKPKKKEESAVLSFFKEVFIKIKAIFGMTNRKNNQNGTEAYLHYNK